MLLRQRKTLRRSMNAKTRYDNGMSSITRAQVGMSRTRKL